MSFVFWFTFLLIVKIGAEHHTLQYLYTLRSEHDNKPEFELTVVFDGLIISHCVSPSLREQPRQDWVSQTFIDEEWRRRNRFCEGEYFFHKPYKKKITEISNMTNGIIQRMRSCTEDDSAVYMSDRWGVNGEYFSSLNPTTLQWHSEIPLASRIESEWNQQESMNMSLKYFELNHCKPSLMKLRSSKANFLKENLRPEVHIFAKLSDECHTICLRCYVIHKYLAGIRIQLTLDGVKVYYNLKVTDPLPNMDGSVQIRLETETSITEPNRYQCVVDAENVHVSVGWDGQTLDKRSVDQILVSGKSENDTKLKWFAIGCMAIVFTVGMITISIVYGSYQVHMMNENQLRNNRELIAMLSYMPSQERFDRTVAVEDGFYAPITPNQPHIKHEQL